MNFKENPLIGELLGEDRSVVALAFCSYSFLLRRRICFQLEIFKKRNKNEQGKFLARFYFFDMNSCPISISICILIHPWIGT